jgi:hypothetical protein
VLISGGAGGSALLVDMIDDRLSVLIIVFVRGVGRMCGGRRSTAAGAIFVVLSLGAELKGPDM